jgi:hypothetical protein
MRQVHTARGFSPLERSLSARDLAALRFIGEGYEVAQYQLHEAVFRGRVATVVSRFVVRATDDKLLISERQNRIGINRLRLTSRARSLLVERGMAHEDELFVPRTGVSPKDLAHTLWINDLRVAASHLQPAPNIALPAWALQRRLQPPPPAIPDLLAIWRTTPNRNGGVVGAEIDLGGEGLRVFLPKLTRLFELVERWSAPSRGLVLVLCRGEQRRNALLRDTKPGLNRTPQVTLRVETLPQEPGRGSIAEFTALLQEGVAALLHSGITSRV